MRYLREKNGGRGDRRVNVERGRGVFMRIRRVKVEGGKERGDCMV